MAILQKVLIFSLLFSLLNCKCVINNDVDESPTDDSANPDSCAQREFSDSEKEVGAYKCCYVYGSVDIGNGNKFKQSSCEYLTKEKYENMDKVIEQGKQFFTEYSIDCVDRETGSSVSFLSFYINLALAATLLSLLFCYILF